MGIKKLNPYQIAALKEIEKKPIPIEKGYINPYNNCSRIISTFHKREDIKND